MRAAFGNLVYILKNTTIPVNLKRELFYSCILPVATYAMETATLTVESSNELEVAQRAMERDMLNISLSDKIRNKKIRDRTKIREVIEEKAVRN